MYVLPDRWASVLFVLAPFSGQQPFLGGMSQFSAVHRPARRKPWPHQRNVGSTLTRSLLSMQPMYWNSFSVQRRNSWLPVLCLNHRGSLKISHRLLLPWSCLYTGILSPLETAWDQARPSWKQTLKWYQHPAAHRQSCLMNQDWEANPGTEAKSDFTWSQDCHLESYLPIFLKNFTANTFLTPRDFPPLTHVMPNICLLTVHKNG